MMFVNDVCIQNNIQNNNVEFSIIWDKTGPEGIEMFTECQRECTFVYSFSVYWQWQKGTCTHVFPVF